MNDQLYSKLQQEQSLLSLQSSQNQSDLKADSQKDQVFYSLENSSANLNPSSNDFSSTEIALAEEIAALSQTLNAVLETLVDIGQDQKIFNQKIEHLESHQREFMSYVHNEISQKNNEQQKDQYYELYDQGISLMQQNKMDLALEHWQKFIEKFHDNHDISSAYYWVGEIYYVKNQDDLAKDAYLYLIEQNPQADKASEALFKVGQICQNQGSTEQAREYWVKLLNKYPQSSVASLAKQQLSQ